jgi:hypothetical protein
MALFLATLPLEHEGMGLRRVGVLKCSTLNKGMSNQIDSFGLFPRDFIANTARTSNILWFAPVFSDFPHCPSL